MEGRKEIENEMKERRNKKTEGRKKRDQFVEDILWKSSNLNLEDENSYPILCNR